MRPAVEDLVVAAAVVLAVDVVTGVAAEDAEDVEVTEEVCGS